MNFLRHDPKTHYLDFTINNYSNILIDLKKSYKFIEIHEIERNKNFVILRHDCDLSLNRALDIAKIEFDLDISSTFYLNPHSDFYSIFEKSQFSIVKKLLQLNHKIGLHLDCEFYEINSRKDLCYIIESEINLLESLFGTKISSFSFHNPRNDLLQNFNDDFYSGIANTYGKSIRKIPYCSDSNGYWRHQRLSDFIEDNKEGSIHILTHPGWWTRKPMKTADKIDRAISGRKAATLTLHHEQLDRLKRKEV